MNKLYFVWAIVLAAIVGISFIYKGESTHFYGIAETREIVVNSENPVEIKKIHVVQGQLIKENDTLIEFNRPELTMKISEIAHQLDGLKAQKQADVKLSRSQIRELKAEQEAKASEINSQIKELEAQYELNKKLTSGLKSIKKDKINSKNNDAENPIKIRITGLKKELALVRDPSQIKIDQLKSELLSTGNPAKIQIQRLEEELRLLQEEKAKLITFAQINGIIGSVNFKEGEKVSPFSPIVTLHTKSPSYVKGYIHENVYNKVSIGKVVGIHSLSDKSCNIQGEVVGVGSRIIEYPLRLRKRPEIQIWGREIVIKIPHDNSFLLGEKVLITSSKF